MVPKTATKLNSATGIPRSSVFQMSANVPGMIVVPAAPKHPERRRAMMTVAMFLARAIGMNQTVNRA